MSQSGDVLERFLEALVQEITIARPEYLTSPFTVAEIYQDLVPYRSHQDLIGVEMNGDYEDALIRMLAGEGDYLLLDSEVARREMQEELASSNPNTALFQEFAAVEVRLHPSRVPSGAGSGPEVPAETPEANEIAAEVGGTRAVELEAELEVEREVELKVELGAGVEAGAELEAPEVIGHIETAATPALSSFEEPAPEGPVSTDAEPNDVLTVCHWCREDLPVRDSIHFCPFCGSGLRPSPCRECGKAMEAWWQFCVSCGADVRD